MEYVWIGLGVIAALIVVFLIIVSTRPNTFSVSRSATIDAPVAKVFEQVNDFRKWQAWSPWAKRDPNMKTTYEGASSGVGAINTWNGDRHVGEGRQTIIESKPNERIRTKLEFIRPFRGENGAQFTFQPQGNQTLVTWSMDGKLNFFTKAFGMFMSMDSMIGKDFESGLAGIKAVTEGKTAAS